MTEMSPVSKRLKITVTSSASSGANIINLAGGKSQAIVVVNDVDFAVLQLAANQISMKSQDFGLS